MRINHNISAQLANVSLKKIDNKLSASLERLSTGYKINKAADDSAGMAISNKMRTQIKALDQASRNAADGDSIIQTAEGAMGEIESILQRVRELAVQASNDTLALEDRMTVQEEVDKMLDEVDRIAETTQFNGKPLLDGSSSRTTMSNTLSVQTISASTKVPRLENGYDVTVTAVAEKAEITVDYTVPSKIRVNGYTFEISAGETTDEIRERMISMCDAMNLDVSQTGDSFTLTSRAAGSAQKISVRSANETQDRTAQGKDAEIELGAQFTPADAYSYKADGGIVTIVGNGGFEMQIDVAKASAGDTGNIQVEDAGLMVLQIGANEHQTLEMDFTELTCKSLCLRDSDGVDLINACTQIGANDMISALDDAINKVSQARSALGAYQNRLEATRDTLDVSSENLTNSMSRITDTDMAAEMTEYTQQSVLSQAATSMLSQANNRPQQIMSLLQS
ncbi:MAG: hypothetical protein MR316_00670 [Lachnospiraceae bacterium]|nr:hypothetical protein [Lachnospiraceae bacterium]